VGDCIFCKIVHGDLPCHKIWENDNYIAFLSIYPNTEGFSVVIPKKHYSSYFAEVPKDVRDGLVDAATEVAKTLDAKLEDVGRTAMIFEGFGVDHLHAKLFPMHGTANMNEWEQIKSNIDTYFKTYLGYISSHDSERADDAYLADMAKKIRD